MALRDKLTERAAPYLRPNEQVQQAFLAQGGMSPWMAALGGALVALLAKPRIIVVTNERIIVLSAGKVTATKPKAVVAELPRSFTFGPVKGLWGKAKVGDEELWVHKRFHKDMAAADAAAS